ncbi:glycosyltransferase [Catalinimonas sp. 4WD22]|uniref:glycosyltransferase family 2 protein n=1 Tax=Catalinimonas locisalis TaxID=3133978 RepID=UPI003100F9F2
MSQPLVSIICLCYNHQDYVAETLASVWKQDYGNIEVFIVDDRSSDGSVDTIQNFLTTNPCPYSCKTLFLEKNIGNCAAFNRAWRMARGKYVIDLATDDVILPNRVSAQVDYFEQLPEEYGVLFTESQYIDADGKPLEHHFGQQYKHIRPIPTGDVYQEVVARYFISSPTMMYKNEVLHDLNGYDEALAYEDFDFWVRSARKYKYAYLKECTTLVRRLENSMSRKLYERNDRQLFSTYLVCKKVYELNETKEENNALVRRLNYELRHTLLTNNYSEANQFLALLKEIKGNLLRYKFIGLLIYVKPNLCFLRKRIWLYSGKIAVINIFN